MMDHLGLKEMNLNTVRDQMGGAGTQTAGLAFGGQLPPNAMSNATEEYDGTSWTSGNNMVYLEDI